MNMDSNIDVGIWKRTIWISRRPRRINIDGVAIPLFLNSPDIFTKSMLVLLSLLQLWEYSKLMPLSFKRPHLDP